jgi:hypothetical protein
VEQLFRTAKALMRTRPIYHSSDAAIRGHVFCAFLADQSFAAMIHLAAVVINSR